MKGDIAMKHVKKISGVPAVAGNDDFTWCFGRGRWCVEIPCKYSQYFPGDPCD